MGPNFLIHQFKINIIFYFVIFVATKNGRKTNLFSHLSFVAVFRSGIRDPGWTKIRIRDKHPGYATLIKIPYKRIGKRRRDEKASETDGGERERERTALSVQVTKKGRPPART
jgi:hypothetical protein